MRFSIAVAVTCLSTIGVSLGDPALASIRKYTEIPSQKLGSALQMLAKQREFQIICRADLVAQIYSHAVTGELTSEEALEKLLNGTNLTFQYLDERTITIVPLNAQPGRKGKGISSFGSPEGGGSSGRAANPSSNGQQQAIRMADASGEDSSNKPYVHLAQASEQTGEQASKTSDKKGEDLLAEVVVTAQKRAERLQDVPISISVVDGDKLDASTFSGVADLINTLPGISTYGYDTFGAGSIITIRGVSAAGGAFAGASTVAYYLDGVSVGFIRQAILPDPNLYDLQDIEVLRGPQGTLYGANALNGAVLVNTHDPDLNDFDIKARALTSTTQSGGGNYGGDMTLNAPVVDGKLAMRLTLDDAHGSGWINSPVGSHINSTNMSNVRYKLKSQPMDDLSVTLTAWRSQTHTEAASESLENGFFTTEDHKNKNDQRFDVLGIKLNYDFSSFTASSVTSYLKYSNVGIFDLSGFTPGVNAPLELNSRVYSEEVNLISSLQGPWHWSAGALYRYERDDQKEWENLYAPPQAPLPQTTLLLWNSTDASKSAAVYGEIGRRFATDWQLSLGLRYFHDNARNYEDGLYTGETGPLYSAAATFHALTPRALLQWYPNKDLTAYVTYSQGFRSGLIQSDLVHAVLPDILPAGPDKLTNYEVGVKGALFDRRVTYDLAVYYNDWKYVQQSISVPYYIGGVQSGTVAVELNGQGASGAGAEISLSTRPLSGLELDATFGWNNLHFDSNVFSAGALLFHAGDRLDYSPEYTGNVSAQYSFALGGSGLKGQLADSVNYISKLKTTYLGTTATALFGDAMFTDRGSFSVIFPKHWTASLFVDNAFNNRETPIQFYANPEYSVRIRPRTYGLTVDYRFDER